MVAWLAVPAIGFGLEIATTHPRLLVRHENATVGIGPTRALVRQRRLRSELAPYAKLGGHDGNWEGQLTPALQTLLSGDPKAQAIVRDWLLEQTQPSKRSTARQGPGHMAIAFDWIHATLTPDERRRIAENIRLGTDAAVLFLRLGEPDINHNFTYMALFSVALSGLALHDEPGFEKAAAGYLAYAREWLQGPGGVYEAGAARGGAWPEGNQYGFTECTRLLVVLLHAWRSATDEDPFAGIRVRHGDFLRGTARFYMAMTRPDFTFERLGDMNQFKPLLRDQHRFVVEALAAGLRSDGGEATTAAMLEHFSDRLHERYGGRDTHHNFDWGMLVFADPDAPRDARAYASQPLGQVFGRGTLDLVALRSRWDEDGVAITFQAGDHFVDHQHFDKGAFTIYHRGALAIDSGAYDRMYGPHHRQYATRSIAHNVPLVFDPEQPVPAEGYKRDGGQRVLRGLQHHARWTEFLAHREREGLDAANLVRFEHGSTTPLHQREDATPLGSSAQMEPAPFATYAVAQAELSGAYGPSVRRLQRTLAYWPAAQIVLVDDAIDLTQPLAVAFSLHTIDPPLAAESDRPESGAVLLGRVPWWVVTRKGGVDLGKHQQAYDGRLFLRTLAPEDHVAHRIGGRGFEWWVNGINYKPAGNAGEPRESGAWRIEIAPPAAATRHRLTHALFVGDATTFKMPEGEMLRLPPGWRGAHVAAAPEVVLLIREVEQTPLPLDYQVATVLPCLHLIVGLEPGRNVEVRCGDVADIRRVSAEGVLAFHDPEVGTRGLRLRGL